MVLRLALLALLVSACDDGSGTTDAPTTDGTTGTTACPVCDPGHTCVFFCDGYGDGGFIRCEPNPEGCEAGNFACSAACERSLCGAVEGQPSPHSCQTGTYCAEVPGAFYCQGV